MALLHECDKECSAYSDKDHPCGHVWVIGEWKFNRCPKSQIDTSIYWFVSAFRHYRNGILPYPGGWMSQPKKYIEAMEFIEVTIAQHENKKDGSD